MSNKKMKIQDWPKASGLRQEYIDAWEYNANRKPTKHWGSNIEVESSEEALDKSFCWEKSPQGENFWNDVSCFLAKTKFRLPKFDNDFTETRNKKKSSVDWLFDELQRMQYFIGNDMMQAFKQARAMHREEIAQAYSDGLGNGMHHERGDGSDSVLDEYKYYKQTFETK